MVGQPLDLLIPARFVQAHRRHLREFADSPDIARRMGVRHQVCGRHKDGHEFPAEASISKLELAGERVFTAILRDISERRRAEDALQKARTELAHVIRVTTLGELAASIAHEINQPLGAIVNNANAALRLVAATPNFPPEARQALSEIVQDANRASAIIARIRTATKRSSPEKSPLQLRDVLGEVLALTHGELLERRITVRTDLAQDLPLVSGDRVELQQVLLNLVVNGLEAMSAVEQDRRLMVIRAQRDELDSQPAVLITVQDLGTGFRPEDTDRLFEPFYTTKPHGLGMGLRISRSIVEAHGGRLWATPNNGPGATFSCALPAEN